MAGPLKQTTCGPTGPFDYYYYFGDIMFVTPSVIDTKVETL